MTTALTDAAPAATRPAEQSAIVRVSLLGMALLLVAVTKATLTPLSDPDTWWHLRLGDLFMGHWSVRDPGQLTSFASEPWVPTQWLSEALASVFEQSFGLPGVVWLVTLTCLLLATVIYVTCRRENDVLPATVATAMSVLGMSASLSARPHLVTYLLLAITMAAWLRTCGDLRARWWLVPLTWVWACSHGMWFTGPLVGLAVTLGLALDRRLDARRGATLTAVSLVSVLVAAVTPVGPKLLLAPFAVNEVTPYITEWGAPSFRETAPAITAVMFALVVVILGTQGPSSLDERGAARAGRGMDPPVRAHSYARGTDGRTPARRGCPIVVDPPGQPWNVAPRGIRLDRHTRRLSHRCRDARTEDRCLSGERAESVQ